MHGRWIELPLETFGGLCDAVHRNDLPRWMARTANDCAWKMGAVGKRPGFVQWLATAYSYQNLELFRWASRASPSNPSGLHVVLVRAANGGTVYAADGTVLWGDGGWGVGQVMTGAQFYSDLAMTFSDGDAASGQAVIFRPSPGTVISGYALPLHLAPPPTAPSVTVLTGGGSMTAGDHTVWFTYEGPDGAMSPPTPSTKVTVAASDRIQIAAPALADQLDPLRAIWVWVSPAGSTQDGYAIAREAPDAFPVVYGEADGVLTTNEKLDLLARRRTQAPNLAGAVCGPYKGRLCYLGVPHRYLAATGGSQNTAFQYHSGGGWAAPTAGGVFQPGRYQIQFDGASPSRGKLTNSGLVLDDLGDLCKAGVSTFSDARWGIRVAVSRSAGLTNASLRVGAEGTAGTWSVDIPATSLETYAKVFEVEAGAGAWSNNMKIFVEGIGPGVNSKVIEVWLCEVCDPGSRSADETAWWSQPAFAREVDQRNGAVTVAVGSGQKLRGGFELGDRFFYALDRSIWVTAHNGGEPSSWPIEKVADGPGAASYRALAATRDWAVMANELGCWIFTGGAVTDDQNLAREIPETWARIAWAEAGHLVWVQVIESLKQVWVGVPLDGATTITHTLVLDYQEGLGAGLSSGGVGRRWSVWSVASHGRALEFRDRTGEELVLITKGGEKILKRDAATFADDGAAYGWTWESGSIGPDVGGLGFFRRLLVSAEGSGSLGLALVKGSGEVKTLISPTLYSPRRGDQVALLSLSDERVSIRLWQSAVAGTWAWVNRAVLAWMRRPFANVRPLNP